MSSAVTAKVMTWLPGDACLRNCRTGRLVPVPEWVFRTRAFNRLAACPQGRHASSGPNARDRPGSIMRAAIWTDAHPGVTPLSYQQIFADAQAKAEHKTGMPVTFSKGTTPNSNPRSNSRRGWDASIRSLLHFVFTPAHGMRRAGRACEPGAPRGQTGQNLSKPSLSLRVARQAVHQGRRTVSARGAYARRVVRHDRDL
jgi:hypothetical protein